MKGYQISFLVEQDRRIEHKLAPEWLLQLAKEFGISGCTVFSAVENFGAVWSPTLHAVFELADQPREIVMAVTEGQADRLFERIRITDTKLFYIKSPIENGQLGKQSS
jgi:PII-like signaling protein